MKTLKELIIAAREARKAHNDAAIAEDNYPKDSDERDRAEAYTNRISNRREKIITEIGGFPCTTASELAIKCEYLAEESEWLEVESALFLRLALDARRISTANTDITKMYAPTHLPHTKGNMP